VKKLFLFLLFAASTLYAEIKVIPFENGTSYFDSETGKVHIEYSNGDIFEGSGNPERMGFPLFGILRNDTKHIWYEGALDDNEEYTGTAYLETEEEIYEGEFKSGKKNGYGVLTNKKNKNKYEGSFLNDKKAGSGILYNEETGYFYSGQWENGVQNGFGSLITKEGLSYTGEFKNGEISGHGEMVNPSGEKTIADWLPPGIPNGENCTYIGIDGSKYHGEIVKGMFEGYGTYLDKEGNYYEGSFCENQRTGFGKQIYNDGSEYTGFFYGNQRNGWGVHKFANSQYEGEFLNGKPYKTGYFYIEVEDEEYIIIASDNWSDMGFPTSGKMLFGNGDMYDGPFDDKGHPIQGEGIWTTKEERLARQSQPTSNIIPVIYYKDNEAYDLSSVYTSSEIIQIAQDKSFIRKQNEWYNKHKKGVDIAVNVVQGISAGLYTLAAFSVPIAPIVLTFAATFDILASGAKIYFETCNTAVEIKDACSAGNPTLIPGMLKDYGKNVVFDALNIFLSIPGAAGKTLRPLGSKVAKGFSEAGEKIGKISSKVIQKSPHLAKAYKHIEQLVKASSRTVVEAFENSKFLKYATEHGGKISKSFKTNWVKTFYRPLFDEYGDDATRLLFKHGGEIADQIRRNGDILVKATKEYGDDIARAFLKNGDEIAKIARTSTNPEDVAKYLAKTINQDTAIKIAKQSPKLGKILHEYGDDAISYLEKYGDDVIPLLDKHGKVFTRAMKNTLPKDQQALFELFKKNPDVIAKAYSKKGNDVIDAFKTVGKLRQNDLINVLQKEGDNVIDALKPLHRDEAARALEYIKRNGLESYKSIKTFSPAIILNNNIYTKTGMVLDKNGDIIGKTIRFVGIDKSDDIYYIGKNSTAVFDKTGKEVANVAKYKENFVLYNQKGRFLGFLKDGELNTYYDTYSPALVRAPGRAQEPSLELLKAKARAEGLFNPKTGNYIDYYTGKEIVGEIHRGHSYGHEYIRELQLSFLNGEPKSVFEAKMLDPSIYHLQSAESNLSGAFEAPPLTINSSEIIKDIKIDIGDELWKALSIQ